MLSRLRVPAVVLAVTGCGPSSGATATSATEASATGAMAGTDTTGDSSTSGANTDTPTTGAPASCACADPQVVKGDLDVAGLAAFAGGCIGEVTGSLTISGIGDPSLLQPLAGLQRAGSVFISDNPGLVDLSALACLEEVTDILFVDTNPALVDVGALARVRVAPSVHFWATPIRELPTFAPDYHGVATLRLNAMPELVDLDAIAGWPGLAAESIAVDVQIQGAPRLRSVAGLAGPLAQPVMPAVGASLVLSDLPALTALTGLEALRDADLTLEDLPLVTSLAPLAALERTAVLRIVGVPGLATLHGLHGLRTAVELQLGGCGDGDGLDGLADLDGLDALTEVAGSFSIIGNAGLVALAGAPLLATVGASFGGLELVDNPALGADAVAAFDAQVDAARLCFGDRVECRCLGRLPAGLQGCPAAWSGGSMVTAAGAGGALAGAAAFFAWRSTGLDEAFFDLVVLDVDADIDAAKADNLAFPTSKGAPKLVVLTDLRYEDWIDVTTVPALLIQPDGVTEVTLQVTVSERLGDWALVDPADPPRLVGEVTTTDPDASTKVQGTFDAAFCDEFITNIHG